MASQIEQRFLYHGSAVGVGGFITRPFSEIIPPQAGAVLPITGGHSSVRVENFRYRDLISFDAAYSTVSGDESVHDGTKAFNSLVTVTIEGLNIRQVVTARKVVARLVSRQSNGRQELPIHPVGSYFEDLRVAGVAVQPVAHDVLFACQTLTQLADECPKQKRHPVDAFGQPLSLRKPAPRAQAQAGAPGSFEEQVILTSLYQRPDALPAGCTAVGPWGIGVPGFGTVYLGELLITTGSRRLTMIRVKMGSPEEGEVAAGDVGGNGHDYP
jgi:hypothetical protein